MKYLALYDLIFESNSVAWVEKNMVERGKIKQEVLDFIVEIDQTPDKKHVRGLAAIEHHGIYPGHYYTSDFLSKPPAHFFERVSDYFANFLWYTYLPYSRITPKMVTPSVLAKYPNYKDLLSFKSAPELEAFVRLVVLQGRIMSNKIGAPEVEGETVYKKDGIEVVRPLNRKACVTYGSGYQFCVSSKSNPRFYYSYQKKKQSLYFVFNRNLPHTREGQSFLEPNHLLLISIDHRGYIIEIADANNDENKFNSDDYSEIPWVEDILTAGVMVPFQMEAETDTRKSFSDYLELDYYLTLPLQVKEDAAAEYATRSHQLTPEILAEETEASVKVMIEAGWFFPDAVFLALPERIKKFYLKMNHARELGISTERAAKVVSNPSLFWNILVLEERPYIEFILEEYVKLISKELEEQIVGGKIKQIPEGYDLVENFSRLIQSKNISGVSSSQIKHVIDIFSDVIRDPLQKLENIALQYELYNVEDEEDGY